MICQCMRIKSSMWTDFANIAYQSSVVKSMELPFPVVPA